MPGGSQGTELPNIRIFDGDPTVAPGAPGIPNQLMIRTDDSSIYYYAGPLDTDWRLIGNGTDSWIDGFARGNRSTNFGSTSYLVDGALLGSQQTGTVTARSGDGSLLYGRSRLAIVSASVANSVAGYRNLTPNLFIAFRGNVANGPGFKFSTSFGVDDIADSYQATGRIFAGLESSIVAPTDVNPSTLTNLIGVGADSGQTNLRLLIRAAAVPGIDLGAGFPVGTLGNPELYKLLIESPEGNNTDISWRLDRIKNNTFISGVIAAPGMTGIGFGDRAWRSSGTAVASISAIAVWGASIKRSSYQPQGLIL